jgi:aryl-alcohol dehydrogenase-like predicted oxidoreductase
VYGPFANEELVGEALEAENIAAAAVELTPDDLRGIDTAASRIAIEGAR